MGNRTVGISPKLTAGAISGAAVLVGSFALERLTGVALPADVSSAVTLLVMSLGVYIAPLGRVR